MIYSAPVTQATSQKIHQNLVTKVKLTDTSSAIAVPITLPSLQACTWEGCPLESPPNLKLHAIGFLGAGGVPVGAVMNKFINTFISHSEWMNYVQYIGTF